MGNYYEGDITLNINTSKIDFDNLMSVLKSLLSNDEYLGCKIHFHLPNEIKEKLYENYTDAILSDEDIEDDIVLSYSTYWDYYDLIEEDYMNELKYNPNDSTSITISIECCTKYYVEENVESILLNIIDNLKEYTFEYKNLQNAGYVGTIEDEDGTYYKQFFCREEILQRVLEQRSIICNEGCSSYRENCLCENYSICSRAYKIGMRNGK